MEGHASRVSGDLTPVSGSDLCFARNRDGGCHPERRQADGTGTLKLQRRFLPLDLS